MFAVKEKGRVSIAAFPSQKEVDKEFRQLAGGISAPPAVGETFVFATAGTGRKQALSEGLRLIGTSLRPNVQMPRISAPSLRFDVKKIANMALMSLLTIAVVMVGFNPPSINFGEAAPFAATPALVAPQWSAPSTPALTQVGPGVVKPASQPAAKPVARPAAKPAAQAVVRPELATQPAAKAAATTHKVPAVVPQRAASLQPQPQAAPRPALSPRPAARPAPSAKASPTTGVRPSPVVDGKFPTPAAPVVVTPPAPQPVVNAPTPAPPIAAPAPPKSNFVAGTSSGTTGSALVDQGVISGTNDATPDGTTADAVSNPGTTISDGPA